MKFSPLKFVFGTLLLFQVDAVKKELIKEVNICKRNSPELSKCFCDNMNRIVPLLKDGQPTMGIPPIDPIKVNFMKINLPASKSVHINASLYDVMVHELSKGRAVECEAHITEKGAELSLDLVFPEVGLTSNYNATGKFLLFEIASDGDFHGEFSDLSASVLITSTKFMKSGREYLKIAVSKMKMEMKTMKIYFNNVFGNNTELNDNLNEIVNFNIQLLYEEVKPVIFEAIQTIFVELMNDFLDSFPYDMLFPNE